jgi:penicillin-binding protein 1A
LGKNQTGSLVALPIWLEYMEAVLKEVPQTAREVPVGVVSVPTGVFPAAPGDTRLFPEFFYEEVIPPPDVLRPPPPLPLPQYEPPPAFDRTYPPS